MSDLEVPAGARAVPLAGKKAGGRFALVDEADFGRVCPYSWSVLETPQPHGVISGPYAQAHLEHRGRIALTYMHSYLTGYASTDHINHNTLDNRRSNLRSATVRQNAQNRRKRADSAARFKGVRISPNGLRWTAGITVDGKFRHLGTFLSDEDAALAYDAAALEHFGEFAYLNLPPDGRESSAA